MRMNEISGNIHGELSRYLETKPIEDVSDMVRFIARWLEEYHGARPLSWKKGQTGLGTTMYTTRFTNEEGNEQWLAFDDEAGVGDIMDSEPNPASYS